MLFATVLDFRYVDRNIDHNKTLANIFSIFSIIIPLYLLQYQYSIPSENYKKMFELCCSDITNLSKRKCRIIKEPFCLNEDVFETFYSSYITNIPYICTIISVFLQVYYILC